MGQIADSIKEKNSILLARNAPVALVVGAASFLGSHLTDALLEKNIQVVGVDDLENGQKSNLRQASENRNFHMVIESPSRLDLDLARLDYIFVVPNQEWDLDKTLKLFKETKCRLLLLSSIELYSRQERSRLSWLKAIEENIAKFASDRNLNARVLRLGPVYGPRMDFETDDPIVRLINQAIVGDLQKDVALEFSSRALYVSDTVDLIIKTMLGGSTAQKIFDGILPAPYKVSEIKQLLLDPVWYESREFALSELPPWPTPNLEKTIKFLNWHPKGKLIPALRETMNYFKDNEIEVKRFEPKKIEKPEVDEEKVKILEQFKKGSDKKEKIPKIERKKSKIWPKIYILIVLALVGYGLIWPGLLLGWGIFSFQHNLAQAVAYLQKGELEKSFENIQKADKELTEIESLSKSLDTIRKTGFLTDKLAIGDRLILISRITISSLENSILGVEALTQAMKRVTGEKTESPQSYFTQAQTDLAKASEDLSRLIILSGVSSPYKDLVEKAYTLSLILPKLVAIDGSKNYLILVQNNMNLRPAGGFIPTIAKITFEKGVMKKIDVSETGSLDQQFSIHVEPPLEIKDDLGQKDWKLADSTWEPDFPTAARQAQWFYSKETGNRVEGTFALDISAIEGLISATGGESNFPAKAVLKAGDKAYLTEVMQGLLNKIFFLPQNNWPAIATSLSNALDEKHMSIYLDDPKLFAYLNTVSWAGILPRASEENKNNDFLSVVEANMGGNFANYYLDRSYKLETAVDKDGAVSHRLRISYINRSPSEVFPGGTYKNRLRIYLPAGAKLSKVLWAEKDLTRDASSFVDFGRAGYSMLLILAPKEQKTLVLDYSVPVKLEFQDHKAKYRLDIIKQPGTGNDPLEWTISFPLGYELLSQTGKITSQQRTVSTDIGKNRSFEVEFSK